MKKKNLFKIALLAIVAVLFTNCSNSRESEIQYVPFQETEDGQWGMISMDGKVLFKEEFKEEPTVVRNNRFFVKNKKGIWEMYDATEKPKKIGEDYAHASGFSNGRAIVAAKDKPVSIIDTEGKTIKVLDKIENKNVDGVYSLVGDYAVYMTTDSLFGVVDNNGKSIIKPEYCWLQSMGNNKFLAIRNQYKKFLQTDDIEKELAKVKVSILP